jgi:broad specificity phosphatase PhoE
MNRICMSIVAACLLAASLAGCVRSATTVVMTRHAEKAAGDDPELTEIGRSRAIHLADFAQRRGVDGVISTQFRRTRETATPAAQRVGAAVVIERATSPIEEHIARLVDLIHDDFAGETVLVVGHSNTIPLLVAALGGPTVAIEDEDYGDVFVLTLRDDMVIKFEHVQVEP